MCLKESRIQKVTPIFKNVGGLVILKIGALLDILLWIAILIIGLMITARNVTSFLISIMVSGLELDIFLWHLIYQRISIEFGILIFFRHSYLTELLAGYLSLFSLSSAIIGFDWI